MLTGFYSAAVILVVVYELHYKGLYFFLELLMSAATSAADIFYRTSLNL